MTRTLKDTLAMSKRDLMNDTQFDWTRSRPARRWLVVAFTGIATLIAASLGLAIALDNPWFIGGVVIGLMAIVLVMGSINASVRGLTELKTHHLDEWQIVRRDAMFRILWFPMIALLGAAAYLAAMTALPDGFKAGFALWSFFIALFGPTAALAWTYPDEPEA